MDLPLNLRRKKEFPPKLPNMNGHLVIYDLFPKTKRID